MEDHMGRIDESLEALKSIEDGTERAFQLAGFLSTLFKIRGITLIVTGQLAFDSYTNGSSPKPELELATFSEKLQPRILQEIMGEQMGGKGFIRRWTVAGIPIRFLGNISTALPDLCRDFTTDHGVVKLVPAEEMTAERILASVYPVPDTEAQTQARLLLINALTEAFQMDWTALQNLCNQPEYRIGEELAKMRAAAKRDVDTLGVMPDPTGQGQAQPPAPTPLPPPLPVATPPPQVSGRADPPPPAEPPPVKKRPLVTDDPDYIY
jgi:hypothetical protein